MQMKSSVDRYLPFSALILLAAASGGVFAKDVPALLPGGPAADYPIVLGAPFTIDGTTYTPTDKLNVDQVGYAEADRDGGTAISAAHRTLPLPSYVEVTSLDTGKTILVRIERRGPMSGDGLIALSPGAAAQLGITGKTPVRVRRVNPPEIERAALRRGDRAPERLETPKSLVAVLLRKLNPGLPGAAPAPGTKPIPSLAAATTAPATTPAPAKPTKPATPPRAAAAPVAKPAPTAPAAAAATTATTTVRGGSVVQVGAFSNKANAEASAAKVGGQVSAAGRLWRVRMGPYSAPAEAAAALAKAKGAGYSDARIQRAD